MFERQGGPSLKTSNLLGEEQQWALKAFVMPGISTSFHNGLCARVLLASIKEACWVSLFKERIWGQTQLTSVTSGQHHGSVCGATNYSGS